MLCRLLACGGLIVFFAAGAAADDIEAAQADASSTTPQRFQYYLARTYSWQRMSWLAADTGLDRLLGSTEWGRGFDGYGCTYASSFGRRVINNSVEFGAVLALKQDTRYRPSHLTGFLPRVRYAAFHAFLATGEGGRIEPAYARFAGIAGGALIAPAWHRHTLSASGFGQDMAFSALDQVQNSLLTEFSPDLERMGRKIQRKILGGRTFFGK
jgi:hypothetical protein